MAGMFISHIRISMFSPNKLFRALSLDSAKECGSSLIYMAILHTRLTFRMKIAKTKMCVGAFTSLTKGNIYDPRHGSHEFYEAPS